MHIYYIGQTDVQSGRAGGLYFAMELVRGEPLDAVLEDGDVMDPEQARQDMIQVARGLRAALAEGFVHRDVKPSNLIRDADGDVKVADFGLVQPLRGPSAHAEGALVGSPYYMSPEQAQGAELDHRSDMYSLGCSFYHLLTGAPPFHGSDAISVVGQHLSQPPPSLAEGRGDVPPELRSIIERLMSKDADERFFDYDELIAALEAAAPTTTPLAGFWPRAAAFTIDAWLAAALIAVIGWPGALVHLAHVVVGHGYWGQTLGKRLLHLKVVSPHGGTLGLGRSALRTLAALWLPFLIGGTTFLAQGAAVLTDTIERLNATELHEVQNLIVAVAIGNGFMTLLYASGLVMAIFHADKQTAHDLLVDTRVRYRLHGS